MANCLKHLMVSSCRQECNLSDIIWKLLFVFDGVLQQSERFMFDMIKLYEARSFFLHRTASTNRRDQKHGCGVARVGKGVARCVAVWHFIAGCKNGASDLRELQTKEKRGPSSSPPHPPPLLHGQVKWRKSRQREDGWVSDACRHFCSRASHCGEQPTISGETITCGLQQPTCAPQQKQNHHRYSAASLWAPHAS